MHATPTRLPLLLEPKATEYRPVAGCTDHTSEYLIAPSCAAARSSEQEPSQLTTAVSAAELVSPLFTATPCTGCRNLSEIHMAGSVHDAGLSCMACTSSCEGLGARKLLLATGVSPGRSPPAPPFDLLAALAWAAVLSGMGCSSAYDACDTARGGGLARLASPRNGDSD